MNQRALIQLRELCSLPAGPGAGADRNDVEIGEEVKHLEPLLGSDEAGQRIEDPLLTEIPHLRNAKELQVPVHEKFHCVDALLIQPKPFTDNDGGLRAADGVFPGNRLSNVVEQEGDTQRQVRLDLEEKLAEVLLRVVGVVFDPVKLFERLQRMLVHRKLVMAVEVDQTVEPGELRNGTVQNPSHVEHLQYLPNARPPEDRTKTADSLRSVSEICVEVGNLPADPFAQGFTQAHIPLLRDLEDLHDDLGRDRLGNGSIQVKVSFVQREAGAHSCRVESATHAVQ